MVLNGHPAGHSFIALKGIGQNLLYRATKFVTLPPLLLRSYLLVSSKRVFSPTMFCWVPGRILGHEKESSLALSLSSAVCYICKITSVFESSLSLLSLFKSVAISSKLSLSSILENVHEHKFPFQIFVIFWQSENGLFFTASVLPHC